MAISGRYPPAHAQQTPVSTSSADRYGLEVRVGEQGVRIDTLAQDIAEIKATQLRTEDETRANTTGISTLSGEISGIGVVLAFLQIGSMVFAYRKGKPAAI